MNRLTADAVSRCPANGLSTRRGRTDANGRGRPLLLHRSACDVGHSIPAHNPANQQRPLKGPDREARQCRCSIHQTDSAPIRLSGITLPFAPARNAPRGHKPKVRQRRKGSNACEMRRRSERLWRVPIRAISQFFRARLSTEAAEPPSAACRRSPPLGIVTVTGSGSRAGGG
jgi:hypothetical protein